MSGGRRCFLLLAATGIAHRAWAHHGWEAFEQAAPVYLQGPVSTLLWADPHATMELVHRPRAEVPGEVRSLQVPPQQADVDIADLLARARVPQGEDRWRIELPELARLSAWDVQRPAIGDVIGVLARPGPAYRGSPAARAEVLFIRGRAYPMRSDPR
ncbi:DUF6152 family protein [Ramlibacter sp. AN1015]|uniref:DUF6152 family protein n=1 Tax=Ramlibacter sp. AN1015 TaxID=3133428 RepID=UPI0030BAF5CC